MKMFEAEETKSKSPRHTMNGCNMDHLYTCVNVYVSM